MCLIGEHISWVLFVCSYTTAIVSITACLAHAPKKCTQSGNFQFDIKSPSDFKIPSARKLKTLFQKYKLQLTPGIHACLGHVLRKYIYRGFLKDTTTADSHENVEWKSEFIFFSEKSLSWLYSFRINMLKLLLLLLLIIIINYYYYYTYYINSFFFFYLKWIVLIEMKCS